MAQKIVVLNQVPEADLDTALSELTVTQVIKMSRFETNDGPVYDIYLLTSED